MYRSKGLLNQYQTYYFLVSCLGNLWWQCKYHTHCYNVLVFLSYDLWIFCQYFQMNFKWIHTYLLLFSTQWCFLQYQSVLRASGNHFINKNSWFVFSEIRFVLVLNQIELHPSSPCQPVYLPSYLCFYWKCQSGNFCVATVLVAIYFGFNLPQSTNLQH